MISNYRHTSTGTERERVKCVHQPVVSDWLIVQWSDWNNKLRGILCLWWNVQGDLFSSALPLIVLHRSWRNANSWGLQKRHSRYLVNCPFTKYQQTLKLCVAINNPLVIWQNFSVPHQTFFQKDLICPSDSIGLDWAILSLLQQ